MSVSVNTNSPILTALQDLSLNSSNSDAAVIDQQAGQTSAPDSNAVTISDSAGAVGSLDADSLAYNQAAEIGDTAVAAGQTIAGLLQGLQSDATAAQSDTIDSSTRDALNADFKSKLTQITSTISQAGVDGVNLLDGSATGGVRVGPNSSVSLSGQDLSLGGPVLTLSVTASLGSATASATALSGVNASLSNLQGALSDLTDQAGQIAGHNAILGQLTGLTQSSTAVSSTDDADSARLLALQIQQQLSAQPQAIANQSPQLVLSLFR